VIIIPEDRKFEAWDFIHYSASIGDGNKQKRTLTFVQTTISEGKPTDSGLWTIDDEHQRKMIRSMSKDHVVGKVLQVLGVECSEIAYKESEDSKKGAQFVISPTSEDDTVQFVLVTSCPRPTATGQKIASRTKFPMQNLIVVQRPEVEELGIVLKD